MSLNLPNSIHTRSLIWALQGIYETFPEEQRKALAGVIAGLFNIPAVKADALLKSSNTSASGKCTAEELVTSMKTTSTRGIKVTDRHTIPNTMRYVSRSGYLTTIHNEVVDVNDLLQRVRILDNVEWVRSSDGENLRYPGVDKLREYLARLLVKHIDPALLVPLTNIIVIAEDEPHDLANTLKDLVDVDIKRFSNACYPCFACENQNAVIINLKMAEAAAAKRVPVYKSETRAHRAALILETIVHELFKSVIILGFYNPWLPDNFIETNAPSYVLGARGDFFDKADAWAAGLTASLQNKINADTMRYVSEYASVLPTPWHEARKPETADPSSAEAAEPKQIAINCDDDVNRRADKCLKTTRPVKHRVTVKKRKKS